MQILITIRIEHHSLPVANMKSFVIVINLVSVVFCGQVLCLDSLDINEYAHRLSRLEERLEQQDGILRQQSQLIEKLESVNKFKSVQFDKLRQTFHDTIDVLLTRLSKQETWIERLKQQKVNVEFKERRKYEPQLSWLRRILLKNGKNLSMKKRSTDFERESRLLDGSVGQITKPTIAFYAYMGSPEPTPSLHHTLIFNVVKTNVGGGYNSYTGSFTAPVDGVYVFSYSVRVCCHSVVSVEIVKNGNPEGAIIAHSESGGIVNDLSSGIAVISAVKGDAIFVRTHGTAASKGNIYNDSLGSSSFSGWLVS